MCRFVLVICLAVAFAHAARADPYTLDTGDALRISVIGESSYPIEVMVDDAGQISVPLLGVVQARGHTTSSLAEQIQKDFAVQNLILESFVHVDMKGYRPFFISGAVANAGAYPFNPGITVRHAIAIAGGFRALPVGDTLPALRIADLRGERTELLIEEFHQHLRLERLLAEQNGKNDLSPPAQIAPELGMQLINDMTSSERSLLTRRLEAYRQELAYLEASLASAKEDSRMAELARGERAEAVKSQTTQLATMKGLQEKGLATNTNMASAERILNSYQIDLSTAQSQQLRIHQDIITLESAIRRKREEHELDILAQIQEAHLEIGKAQSKLKHVTDKLLFLWSYGSHRSFDELRPAVRISIHRPSASGPIALDATENTGVKAGDVIEIELATGDQFYAPSPATADPMPF